VAGQQRQAAEGVNRQGVPEREQPVGQAAGLLGRDIGKALAEAVLRLAGVEHRLGEAAAILPLGVAGDRQRPRLEALHAASLGLGIGGEGIR